MGVTIEIQEGAVGVPSGGTIGQVLAKKTDGSYDTEWRSVEGVTGGIVQVTISGSSFILQKHPDNAINLTILEINDVILGFEPSGNYIMAQYLGGTNTEFFNAAVYNIFNGI